MALSLYGRLIKRTYGFGRDTCWIWCGKADKWGYGRISIDGESVSISRAVYAYRNPDWDGSGVIRHTCDRPACWNPHHLVLGTHQQNMWDAKIRGRSYSNFTKETIQAVKRKYAEGLSQQEIAREMGIPFGSVFFMTEKRLGIRPLPVE